MIRFVVSVLIAYMIISGIDIEIHILDRAPASAEELNKEEVTKSE